MATTRLKYSTITRAGLDDLRNAYESGETRRGMIPGTAYRITDVPEGLNQPAWAFTPDGLGAHWFGTRDELDAEFA
jgi:hypothetical protein